MDEPVKALMQSWLRTKASDYRLLPRSDGAARELLQQHPLCGRRRQHRLLPRQLRSAPRPALRLDPSRGRQRSATEWQGVHALRREPERDQPAGGWVFNTNNWPYSAAGPDSPKQATTRATWIRAARTRAASTPCACSQDATAFTLDTLRDAAFDRLSPRLRRPGSRAARGLGRAPPGRSARGASRRADRRSCASGTSAGRRVRADDAGGVLGRGPVARAPDRSRQRGRRGITSRSSPAPRRGRSSRRSPRRPTGSPRISARGACPGATSTASSASPATSCSPSTTRRRASPCPSPRRAGDRSPPSATAPRVTPGTKKFYGTSGNSFVAVVEFGERVRAKAVTAGGESGDPASPTSTTRPRATPRATCATSTSIATSSKDTSSANTTRENDRSGAAPMR